MTLDCQDICLRAGEPLSGDPDYWTWNDGYNRKYLKEYLERMGL